MPAFEIANGCFKRNKRKPKTPTKRQIQNADQSANQKTKKPTANFDKIVPRQAMKTPSHFSKTKIKHDT